MATLHNFLWMLSPFRCRWPWSPPTPQGPTSRSTHQGWSRRQCDGASDSMTSRHTDLCMQLGAYNLGAKLAHLLHPLLSQVLPTPEAPEVCPEENLALGWKRWATALLKGMSKEGGNLKRWCQEALCLQPSVCPKLTSKCPQISLPQISTSLSPAVWAGAQKQVSKGGYILA